jgi:dTDP-4-dehydrorhamnose 3,5-epimerase
MEIQLLYSNKNRKIEGPLLLRPSIFKDKRGFFLESWNQNLFNQSVGKEVNFVQDNHSLSKKGVLRGMHYQINPYPQAKLVRCLSGSIFDVIVDIRKKSKSFGEWCGVEMKAADNYQLWIPPGFAHGFLALNQNCIVSYKVDQFRDQKSERVLKWNDEFLEIRWPYVKEHYNLSEKDEKAPNLSEINQDDLF